MSRRSALRRALYGRDLPPGDPDGTQRHAAGAWGRAARGALVGGVSIAVTLWFQAFQARQRGPCTDTIYGCSGEALVAAVLTGACLIGLLAAGFTLSWVPGPIACALATHAAVALGTALIGRLLPSDLPPGAAGVVGLYIVSGAAVAATFGGRGRRWRWMGFLVLVDASRLVDVGL